MDVFLPTSLNVLAGVVVALVGAVLGGFAITRLGATAIARLLAWGLVAGGLTAVERWCAGEPAGFRMLALIGFGLVALKTVVTVEASARGLRALPPGRWLGFSAAWVGMQPRVFARPVISDRKGARELLARGLLRTLQGFLLVACAHLAWVSLESRLLATLLLLPGLSLTLHFGLLLLLAGAWRAAGIDCRPLFRAPLRSQSLSEFWGQRWNLAFSEMTALAVYRPLAGRAGPVAALLASFLFSGLLHEMAISLPVRAGFGLPLLYFALHGGASLLERELERRGRSLRGWSGRLWAMAWLLVPLPLLFHLPFLRGVVWPLIGIPPEGR